ncbi:MAG: M42 family metallopeptidase [Candidatus Aminicenantes bacterium]|nr:M42 family metallopeptidase [Candidatus Aminicenantes bacterium]
MPRSTKTSRWIEQRGRRVREGIVATVVRRPSNTFTQEIMIAAGKNDGPVAGGGPVLIQAKDEPSPLRQGFMRLAADLKIPVQSLTAPDSPLALPFAAAPSEVLTVALPVRFLNTPSEIVDLEDLQALRDLLAAFLIKGAGR